MSKRKTASAAEATGATSAEQAAPAEVSQPATDQPTPDAPEATPPQASVQAPPKGEGAAYTIDNRVGYRKEDSPDGRKRQIRFADREGGGRPDDELLAPVREQKPAVGWASKEKAWQARRNEEGLEAIDSADQKLAEIGRKRTQGQER